MWREYIDHIVGGEEHPRYIGFMFNPKYPYVFNELVAGMRNVPEYLSNEEENPEYDKFEMGEYLEEFVLGIRTTEADMAELTSAISCESDVELHTDCDGDVCGSAPVIVVCGARITAQSVAYSCWTHIVIEFETNSKCQSIYKALMAWEQPSRLLRISLNETLCRIKSNTEE